MKLVLAALVCVAVAIAWYVATELELEHRATVASGGRDPERDARDGRDPRPHSGTREDDARAAAIAARGPSASPDDAFAGASEPGDEEALELDDDHADEDEDLTVVTVRGTVLNERSEAVEGAWVQLSPSSGDDPTVFDAVVEADGTFEAQVPSGSYAVIARAEGWLPDSVPDVLAPTGERLVEGLSLILRQGLSVKGRVMAEREHIDSAAVFLEGNGYRLSVTTSSGGEFEFKGVPAGTYRVASYVQGWGGDARDVVAGSEVTLTLEARSVTGVVVDGAGRPMASATVYLRADGHPSGGSDRDPFGALNGLTDAPPSSCFYGDCESFMTDDHGAFEAALPEGTTLTLGAVSQEGERGLLENVKATARSLVIRVQPAREVKVRVVVETPAAGPEDEQVAELPYALMLFDEGIFGGMNAEAIVEEDGTASLQTWAGMQMSLIQPFGARIEPIDPLPPEVTITEASEDHLPEPLHFTRHSRHGHVELDSVSIDAW